MSSRKKSVLKDDYSPVDGSDYTNKIAKEFLEESEHDDNIDNRIIDKESDKELSSTPCCATIGCMLIPCFFCMHFRTLEEGYDHVNLVCGKYSGTVTKPGCYFRNCCGLDTKIVSKKIQCVDLPNTKIVDGRGNPLDVSAIVVYQILNSRRAVLDVEDYNTYVINQANTTLKTIVSKYPYELMEDDPSDKLCLRSKAKRIEKMMAKNLQENVIHIGVKIHSMQFNELSYAPEIANGMLKKQGALVTLSAKQKIAQGAIDIAFGAAEKLVEKGVHMSPEEKAKLVSNLLTVICGENDNDD